MGRGPGRIYELQQPTYIPPDAAGRPPAIRTKCPQNKLIDECIELVKDRPNNSTDRRLLVPSGGQEKPI